jgi:hypothetical protein
MNSKGKEQTARKIVKTIKVMLNEEERPNYDERQRKSKGKH